MPTLKHRLTLAPKPLIAICLMPVVAFAAGSVTSFNGISLALLLASLVTAHQTLSGSKTARWVLIALLGTLFFTGLMLAEQARHSMISVAEVMETGWFTDAAKLLFWPFVIGLMYSVAGFASIVYLFRSERMSAFFGRG